MTDEIQTALVECAAARSEAATPLVFEPEAVATLATRGEGQLRASLPGITGGWPTVRDEILRACALTGTVAKAIAEFQSAGATEITTAQAVLARTVAERACRLRLADKSGKAADAVGVPEGLVCG